MKKIILSIAALLLTANVQAAEFGFGASLDSDTSVIYLPINVTKKIRLEPYFSSYRQSQDDYSYSYSQYGVGVFNVKEVADSANIFIGARAGALHIKRPDTDTDGWSIAPVAGFEYFPIKQVSLGAEVSWIYSKIKYESEYTGGNDKYRESKTNTAIFIKYYFK